MLNIIADNEKLKEELRKLFEAEFSIDNLSNQMTNEILGQVVRARLDGLILVDRVFKKLETYKTPEKEQDLKNPAR